MLDLFWPILVGAGLLTGYIAYRNATAAKYAFRFASASAEGDEDIKIAPGSFSSLRKSEDAAELAAQDFLKQKECGNIDRARGLGSRYAQAILNIAEGPLKDDLGKDPLIQHHLYLLYSFVVSHVIADHSPNSILAQTSLNVFYGEIEESSAELYKHVSDMAAYSLYILAERSRNHSDDEIGAIFADLCGNREDSKLVDYGNATYSKIYQYCVDEIRQIGYQDV